MRLEDILPIAKWAELEKKINHIFGLNASVFDTNELRITGFKKWANSLCPLIQANEKGRSFICMLAHQNLSQQAQKTKKPVFAECDAGLLKVVVPIFLYGEFLGVFSSCGLLVDGGVVETFLIHKTTGIPIGEIDRLADDIASIQMDKIDSLVGCLMHCIDEIVVDFDTTHGHPHRLSRAI